MQQEEGAGRVMGPRTPGRAMAGVGAQGGQGGSEGSVRGPRRGPKKRVGVRGSRRGARGARGKEKAFFENHPP